MVSGVIGGAFVLLSGAELKEEIEEVSEGAGGGGSDREMEYKCRLISAEE